MTLAMRTGAPQVSRKKRISRFCAETIRYSALARQSLSG
jgi:hypothetical protein